MDQTSLNRIWDHIVVTGGQIDGMIGRECRSQDYLVQLSDGTLWCRSHEVNVWRETAPIRGYLSDAQPAAVASLREASFQDETAA